MDPQEDYEAFKYETITERKQPTTENPNNLGLILKKLQDSNALPHTLTPDNIDNSIKTLVRILSALKKHQQFSRPIVVEDEKSNVYEEGDIDNEAGVGLGGSHGDVTDVQNYPEDTPEGGTPGKAGVDYPALSSIPPTMFNCKTQRYKGFFGDPDTHCQVTVSSSNFSIDLRHLFLGLALLRSKRWASIVFVSERYNFQSSCTNLRLVVQRQMRIHTATLRTQRKIVQIHFATLS